MSRRAAIYDRINAIFHEDWRSEEAVLADLERDVESANRMILHRTHPQGFRTLFWRTHILANAAN